MKNLLLLAIAVVAIAMFAVPSLAETQDECIERCKRGNDRAFGYLAAKDCMERYCYKKTAPTEEVVEGCAAIVKIVIRARLKWLEGKELDLLVDQILREKTVLAEPTRDYLLTGSPIALANLNEACVRAPRRGR